MDPSYIQQYEDFERRHWWFVARRELICDWMDRYGGGEQGHTRAKGRWLDVGCGTGVLLKTYCGFDASMKMGIERDEQCVQIARSRGLDVRAVGDEWELASLGKFDLITLCDVLEHLNDESSAVRAVHGALNDGGRVLVTVPALPGLWSGHDVVNHHYRRYVRKSLLACFDGPEWKVERVSYFSSLLLPMIWMARKLKNALHRVSEQSASHDFRYAPGVVDRTLLAIFRREKGMLHRFSLPLGSSLILVARKTGGT